MKKTIYIIMVLIVTSPLIGCDDFFDNVTPQNELVGDNAIINQQTAENALNGIYGYLDSGYDHFSSYYIADNESRLNFLEGSYRGSFDQTENKEFTVPYTSTYIINPWNYSYKMINAANNLIYYLDKISDDKLNENGREHLSSEARFLRAFAHAYLLKKHGYFWDVNSHLGIIVKDQPSGFGNIYGARSTVSESYDFILKDLEYASLNCPKFFDIYRTCAITASAFKADIHMLRGADGDYELAIEEAEKVISSEEFAMEETYADIFEKGYTSTELLFSRHVSDPADEIAANSGTMYRMFGDGTYKPTEQFLDRFPEDDKRYEYTLDSIVKDEKYPSNKSIIWSKHRIESGNCPMWYMRVAQMYLIKAEAMFYLNKPVQDVLDVLNVLRLRAGNTELLAKDFSDRDLLMNEIFNEYIREIGMENGALYYVAIRMKDSRTGDRLIKNLNPNYNNDDQLCYPIPSTELDFNGEVEQKPL